MLSCLGHFNVCHIWSIIIIHKLCLISGKDLAPENVDEFDKLVLTSPDSSLCWIQYIAFHMERKDYTLARTVVKRALEKINFREEKERFNIYMAWLNLENNFGTEDDTNKVFKEALQCNDEYKVSYVYRISSYNCRGNYSFLEFSNLKNFK